MMEQLNGRVGLLLASRLAPTKQIYPLLERHDREMIPALLKTVQQRRLGKLVRVTHIINRIVY
jgi:hypothetical protein